MTMFRNLLPRAGNQRVNLSPDSAEQHSTASHDESFTKPGLRSSVAPGERLVSRAENLIGLVASVCLLVVHRRQVNWATFAFLFGYIDILGYLPGLVRVRQKKSPVIDKPFYWAYNCTHTFLTGIPVAALLVRRDQAHRWSALAVFIHLFGDRGLLGNFTKAVGSEFDHV